AVCQRTVERTHRRTAHQDHPGQEVAIRRRLRPRDQAVFRADRGTEVRSTPMARWLPVAGLLVLAASAPAADPPKPDAVDRAVRQALLYLQRSQEPEGGWRAMGTTRTAGVSGLCTMAFLSA